MLGVAFNVTEIREDESSTVDSSIFSSYSSGSGSVDFSDRSERIAELLDYLRDDSSGYSSLESYFSSFFLRYLKIIQSA